MFQAPWAFCASTFIFSLNRQIHEKTIALEVGLNLSPSKHRLQSSCFIHYAMTPLFCLALFDFSKNAKCMNSNNIFFLNISCNQSCSSPINVLRVKKNFFFLLSTFFDTSWPLLKIFCGPQKSNRRISVVLQLFNFKFSNKKFGCKKKKGFSKNGSSEVRLDLF